MLISSWVYLNGSYISAADARISPFDRGFLFAHAAYEVTAVFNGQLIDFEGHMARLERTLAGLSLPSPMTKDAWLLAHEELLHRNETQEGLVYLQVSSGDYPERDFAGPKVFEPSVFMFSKAKPLIGADAEQGISAITLADTRWARRDLKTTQLLSQVLAYRRAKEAGAATAILHEDGLVTEAASANVWVVTGDGKLLTRDLSKSILPGITRGKVLDMLHQSGIRVSEAAFDLSVLSSAREVFTTSAGALIAPVIEIDGKPVGSGRPGAITRQVQRLYYTEMGANLAARAPWL